MRYVIRWIGLMAMASAITSPLSAQASRWVLLDPGMEPKIEADSTTIIQHGAHVDVWVRTTYAKPERYDASSATDKRTYTEAMVRWAIDCPMRSYQILKSTLRTTGAVVSSGEDASESDLLWKIPVPESIGEKIVTSVCATPALRVGHGSP